MPSFSNCFPIKHGRIFLAQPVGQLYYAIAEPRSSHQHSCVTETVAFSDGKLSRRFSGRLGPGEGRHLFMSALGWARLLWG